MKARKTMTHRQLTDEVTHQLGAFFHVENKTIKLMIEELIDKEYLARSERNSSVYIYLP